MKNTYACFVSVQWCVVDGGWQEKISLRSSPSVIVFIITIVFCVSASGYNFAKSEIQREEEEGSNCIGSTSGKSKSDGSMDIICAFDSW